MIQVKFKAHERTKEILGLWQYDRGRTLLISGLELPEQVKIEFSLHDKIGETTPRTGITKDGVTEVAIPNNLLANEGCHSDYCIFAFIYVEDEQKGFTYRKIVLHVKTRSKPGDYDVPDEAPDYVPAQTKKNTEEIKRLDTEKVSFPEDAEGNTDFGTDGQVLTSNGDGTARWEGRCPDRHDGRTGKAAETEY